MPFFLLAFPSETDAQWIGQVSTDTRWNTENSHYVIGVITPRAANIGKGCLAELKNLQPRGSRFSF